MHICVNVDESQKNTEWKKPDIRIHCVWLSFYETLEKANLIHGDRKHTGGFLGHGYKEAERSF